MLYNIWWNKKDNIWSHQVLIWIKSIFSISWNKIISELEIKESTAWLIRPQQQVDPFPGMVASRWHRSSSVTCLGILPLWQVTVLQSRLKRSIQDNSAVKLQEPEDGRNFPLFHSRLGRGTCSSPEKWSCDLKRKSDVRKKKDCLFLCTCYTHINPQSSEVYKQSCVLSHSTGREVN